MSLLWLINIMTATEITHVFNLRNSSMLSCCSLLKMFGKILVQVNEGLVNQHILTNGACGIIYCKHGSFCELIVIYILIWLNFQICVESFSFWLFLFSLIHKMLQREPVHRAKLGDILNHKWLCMGDYIAPSVPLISREHLSDDDHNYLIEKMVEGNIATKDEILQ